MATVPTALTAAVGDKVAASTFNSGVKDPINFLLKVTSGNRAAVCLTQNSAQTGWTDSAFTAVTFDTETLDNDAQHSTSSNTSRVVIGTTLGWYLVSGTYASASNTNGNNRRAAIYLNGAVINGTQAVAALGRKADSTSVGLCTVTTPWFLVQSTASGDYIELMGYMSTGSAGTIGTAVSASYRSSLTVVYLGSA